MNGVVPAWKLLDLLHLPDVEAYRSMIEQKLAGELAAERGSTKFAVAEAGSVLVSAEAGDDWLDPAEAARRRDATLRNMLNTPPKPQSEMKLGRRKRES